MAESYNLVVNGDMAASVVSDPVYLHRKTNYAMHFIYTGSPTGNIYIAVSIDGINWVVLDNSTTAISAAGDTLYNVSVAGYLMARAHYARTSGTGTLNVIYSTKEVS